MNKMDIGGVTVFLGAALIVCAIVLFIITSRYIDLCEEVTNNDSESRIETLISEKDKLILDNISLQEKNEELYEDNVKLSEAVKELRAINTELLNAEKVTETNSLLPVGHTNTYRCEPYMIFDKYDEDEETPIYKIAFHPKSEQYRLQQDCYTDYKTGIRIYNVHNCERYYCAAMAGAYGTDIGHAYKVKLKCGTEFNVILADFKHPIDNVRDDDYGDADTNYDGQPTTSVIEFIVDMEFVPDKVKQAGTMSALDIFGGLYGDGGDIVSIEDLGKVW